MKRKSYEDTKDEKGTKNLPNHLESLDTQNISEPISKKAICPKFQQTVYTVVCHNTEYHLPEHVIQASSMLKNSVLGLKSSEKVIVLPDEYEKETLTRLLLSVRDIEFQPRTVEEANNVLLLCERMAFERHVDFLTKIIIDLWLRPVGFMDEFDDTEDIQHKINLEKEDKTYISQPSSLTDKRESILVFLPTALDLNNKDLYQSCLHSIYSLMGYSLRTIMYPGDESKRWKDFDSKLQPLLMRLAKEDLIDLILAQQHTIQHLPVNVEEMNKLRRPDAIKMFVASYGESACRCSSCIKFKMPKEALSE